jgi:hypothetical protein
MLKISKQQHEEMAQVLNLNAEDMVVRVNEPSSSSPKQGKALVYISEEQDNAMAQDMVERVISKGILFLEESAKEWCQNKSIEERKQFVRLMVELAWSKNIFKETNIQSLVFWQVDPGFTIPLSKYLDMVLTRENFKEDYRIKRFFEAITSNCELILMSFGEENKK